MRRSIAYEVGTVLQVIAMTRGEIINQRANRRKRLWARFDESSQGGK